MGNYLLPAGLPSQTARAPSLVNSAKVILASVLSENIHSSSSNICIQTNDLYKLGVRVHGARSSDRVQHCTVAFDKWCPNPRPGNFYKRKLPPRSVDSHLYVSYKESPRLLFVLACCCAWHSVLRPSPMASAIVIGLGARGSDLAVQRSFCAHSSGLRSDASFRAQLFLKKEAVTGYVIGA